MYQIFIPPSVKKSLSKIPLPWKERIARAIDALKTEPFYGGKMKGKLANYRKIRVWPYRVIYQISKERRIIKIVEIEHRGNVSYG